MVLPLGFPFFKHSMSLDVLMSVAADTLVELAFSKNLGKPGVKRWGSILYLGCIDLWFWKLKNIHIPNFKEKNYICFKITWIVFSNTVRIFHKNIFIPTKSGTEAESTTWLIGKENDFWTEIYKYRIRYIIY